MIFDDAYKTTSSIDESSIPASPYALGAEGALMHVYENECNYNALMKAVALSELKYYKETGESLLAVNEAARNGFIEKVKTFFKKIKEKIVAIFNKFVAAINSQFANDKSFVSKYKKTLEGKNTSGFEFSGYKYEGLAGRIAALSSNTVEAEYNDAIADIANYTSKAAYGSDTDGGAASVRGASEASKEAALKAVYKNICGADVDSSSEMRTELVDACKGEYDTFTPNLTQQLGYISDTKKAIADAEKAEKNIVSAIDKFVDKLSKLKDLDKDAKSTDATDAAIKSANYAVETAKSISNAYTIGYGVVVDALKARNKQARAICVKALSYKKKNEAASYSEGSIDDIFAGVAIL